MACGLGPILIGPPREERTDERRERDGVRDRLRGAYQTKYPIAWYGEHGWRFYDAASRGIKHWFPGAPHNQPRHKSVQEIRDELEKLERQRQSREEEDAADAEADTSAGRRRPMGLLHFMFASSAWRRMTRWFMSRPGFTFALYWLFITGVCVAMEFASAEDIRRTVSGFLRSVWLAVMQSLPTIAMIRDSLEFAGQAFRKLGKAPAIAVELSLVPYTIFKAVLFNLNRTRGLLTTIALAVLMAGALGMLMDVRWFGAPSIRERMVYGGRHIGAYMMVIIFVGGWLLPVMGVWLLQQKFPRTALWIVDNVPLPRLSETLAKGAVIGTAIAFFMRYNILRNSETHVDGMPMDAPGGMGGAGRVALVQSTKRYEFQIKALVAGLATVMLTSLLLAYIYPIPYSVTRARDIMHRTARWRPS